MAAGIIALGGCARAGGVTPLPFALPDSLRLLDGATGAPLDAAALLHRLQAADFVLLGEVHDNAAGHEVRGALLRGLGSRRPPVVFEQFAAADSAIAVPQPGDSIEGWLDRHGFDRRGWRWPLHRPVVDAALAAGRSLWGSNVPRASLRPVVRDGEAGAPDALRRLMERTPLDSLARGVLDRDLIEGHCGQLPAAQLPGMRAAQIVRDAAMTRAMLLARAGVAPVVLVAGNGHVRKDVAVPRLLETEAPGARTVVVGVLEREPDGSNPPAAERAMYDLVIVTPRQAREDPCLQLRR